MNNMQLSKLTELYFIKKGKTNYCITQMVKNLPVMPETQVQSLGQEDPPGEGHGNPPQYSCLENSRDREAWQATVRGVAKSWTQLSDLKKGYRTELSI